MLRPGLCSRIVALGIAIPALTYCGSSPKKEADKILGRDKKEDKPFVLDGSKFPGVYIVSEISGQRDGGSFSFFGGDVIRAHQEAWRITDTTVEIFRVKHDQKVCGARSWTIEGNATMVIAAANGCPVESIEFVAQDRLSFRTEPFVVKGDFTADRMSLSKVSARELAASAFTWDSDFKVAPNWIKEVLPKEATDDSIASARKGFVEAQISDSQLKIATDLSAVWGTESFGLKVASFKSGKAIHWSKLSKESGDTACYFVVKDELAEQYRNGISIKVDQIEISHSRRLNGLLTIGNGEQIESNNAERANQIVLKLKDAPEGMTFSCSSPAGPDVITIEKVKAALGTLVTFEKE